MLQRRALQVGIDAACQQDLKLGVLLKTSDVLHTPVGQGLKREDDRRAGCFAQARDLKLGRRQVLRHIDDLFAQQQIQHRRLLCGGILIDDGIFHNFLQI